VSRASAGVPWLLAGWCSLAGAQAGCEKVPIVDIAARFALADSTWFAEEDTLFVFYRVDAEQGLGPASQIELAYRTDETDVGWTPLQEVTPVHSHVPVDCGARTLCGSTSLRIPQVPRQVRLRLRFHRDGQTALDAPVAYNVVGRGPAHSNRSLAVYGVFDEDNQRVEWRVRHQFPSLRNEQVRELGLRRSLRVSDPRYGEVAPPLPDNPYGYAFAAACPPALVALGWPPRETMLPAVFDDNALPLQASASPLVCAAATVTDGKGTFEAAALARKNPEVRPAFPLLRSPIRENTEVGFLLRPCARTISEPHRAVQVQRLLIAGEPEICVDDERDPTLAQRLAAQFRARLDEKRALGKDLVLTLALHHDDASGALAEAVEQALEQVLPFERDRGSPRVSGAFVFDSVGYTLKRSALRSLVLWCPARAAIDDPGGASQRACPLLPIVPQLRLGPFSIANLPILPSRAQYLKFIDDYSEAQAGRMRELKFLAPERTPTSQNVPVGEFGVATFFNNEVLTPAPADAFSYCASGDPVAQAVVFRTAAEPDVLPIAALPEFHELAPQPAYTLGLLWDFPFLARLTYESPIAGSISAFSLTVPFGIAITGQDYYGAELWQEGEFSLRDTLLQCTRFCNHPTFDPAGVYQVTAPFRASYRDRCYRPRNPVPDPQGAPRDP
jgi:hypothetical protein